MGFFSRILRFLFWVLVLSWGVALFRRAVGWMLRGGAAQPPQGSETPGEAQGSVVGRRLVRDPVCGVHVAEVLSIPLHDGGDVVHFCSTACRDRYLAGTKKFAANA